MTSLQSFTQISKPAIVLKKETPQEAPKPELYVVKDNDTLDGIAQDHHTSPERLFSKNSDIVDPDVITTGETVVIPLEGEVLADRPIPAPVVSTAPEAPATIQRSVSAGYSNSGKFPYGWCTYFASSQRPDLPVNGNAAQWIAWANSSVPRVGAVAVNTYAVGGLGHVGIVLASKGNQVLVRSMNYHGFGVVSDDWTDASYWAGYIL